MPILGIQTEIQLVEAGHMTLQLCLETAEIFRRQAGWPPQNFLGKPYGHHTDLIAGLRLKLLCVFAEMGAFPGKCIDLRSNLLSGKQAGILLPLFKTGLISDLANLRDTLQGLISPSCLPALYR